MNLFSEQLRGNPFPAYAQAHVVAPVMAIPELDLWAIFGYDDVRRALTDHDAFSSAPARANRPNPPWLVFFDPPRHTRLRVLISTAFTPRMVAALEPRIEGIARELLDAGMERGSMDLVKDFAEPLPLRVIAGMIGLSTAEWLRFRRWSEVIVRTSSLAVGSPAEAAAAVPEAAAVGSEMMACLENWMIERRKSPRSDLLTALMEAEVAGERLAVQEIFGFVQLLLIAGTETTSNLIANAVVCFTEHPEALERLRQSPELLPRAIEEVLRFHSPVQWMLRATVRDVELSGRTIPAGKLVLVMIGSANRDPSHFADPDRFDIDREPNPHLAFGHGIHFCVGAPLSRLEARVALTALLERFGDFRLAGAGPWPRVRALHLYGPSSLPITRAADIRAAAP